MKEDSFEQFH